VSNRFSGLRGPILSLALAALPVCAQSPTFGFAVYSDTFKVQKPYDIPVEERFSDTGGMYTTKVLHGDKPFEKGNTTQPRTEMRWTTWSNQNQEHMFEADVMYESGCLKTCIFQVKSNTSGEAVYLRVIENGDLLWLGNGAIVRKGGYGVWFNLKAAYNPASHVSRVWINDELKQTGRYSGGGWYFKNGCYTVDAPGPAVAHFKNIKHRIPGVSSSVFNTIAAPGAGAPRAIAVFGNGASILSDAGYSAFDSRGRALVRGPYADGIRLLRTAATSK
jgi:hypothetical protein